MQPDHGSMWRYQELRTLREDREINVVAHIRQLLLEVGELFGIETHEDLSNALDKLDAEQRAVVFRIVNEAVWNAAKHSCAGTVRVTARCIGRVVVVTVKDDGRGFQPKDATGYGLRIMRARAEAAGGELSVISGAGKGANVQVRFETR